MEPKRHDQSPDQGPLDVPKLTIAGRLDTTLNGRPLVVDASEQTLRFTFASVWDAWRNRSAFREAIRFAELVSDVTRINAEVAIGDRVVLPLLPNPHWTIRRFVPRGSTPPGTIA